jgi:hypothetical protein
MVRRFLVVVALVMAVITATAVVPPRAVATDNLVYIIPAAIGGVVMVAVLIAILVVDRKKEPELDLAPAQRPLDTTGARLRVGPACRTSDGSVPLLCW